MAQIARVMHGDPGYFRTFPSMSGLIIDAVPFYEGFRMKRTLAGSGTITDATYYTNWSISHVFEEEYTRIETRAESSSSITFLDNDGIRDGEHAIWLPVTPAQGECQIQSATDADKSRLPVEIIITPPDRPSEIIGSYSTYLVADDSLVETVDIYGSMDMTPPTFNKVGIGVTVPRARSDEWGWSYAFIDISGWTITDWRDLRGVQTCDPYVVNILGAFDTNYTDEFEIS